MLQVVYRIDARDFNHVCCTVPLARLMPTQPELIPAIIDHYRKRTRMTDPEGALPYGIRFKGSSTVFITNGHHRWYVCRERGRKAMRMWVHTYPTTLREAMRAACCPPAPPKRRAAPRRQPAAATGCRQLAFQFA